MPHLSVNDVNLYYEITGSGDPLLFIHGLGSSSRDWENQVPFFAEHYKVITVDVRGHGLSDKPSGRYSVPLFAADIAAFINELAIAPCHIVGLSMGGMIAFQLAVDTPDVVRSMVIVNSAPALIIKGWKAQKDWWQRQIIVRLLGMRKIGEVLAGRLFPKPEHEAIRQTFAERWAENDKQSYLKSMDALKNWSVEDGLGRATMPTLIAAADQDYSPVAHKEAYMRHLKNARLHIFDDSRHATPVEHPAEFNRVVANFLESS